MSVEIKSRCGDVSDVRVKVQRLRIRKVCIRHGSCLCSPVRRGESSETIRVVSGSKVVEAGFSVPFFAGEFVMIVEVVNKLKFAAPGIIVRFVENRARSVGDD